MVGKLGGEVLEIYTDSHLVVGQVNGEFEDSAQSGFKSFTLRQIPRR